LEAEGMVDEQPLRRRWIPTDEAAMRDAFDQAILEERNWCELKREIGNTKGATVELARDLASLSVDGGTLIVGLDEDAPEGNPLHPVELSGLAERVEQVAHTRVHPPLLVDSTPVRSAADGAKGYLVVHVPASALAPHQVEGIYYGRGDKTKRRLTDPEVERLFERRKSWSANAFALLDQLMASRGATEEQRMPQLFVAARPVAGWPEMFRPIVGNRDWQGRLEALRVAVCNDATLNDALREQFAKAGGWSGNFSYVRKFDKTASGARIGSTHKLLTPQNFEWSVDFDIDELGTAWFSMGAIGALDQDFNGIKYTGVYIDSMVVAVMELLTAIKLLSEAVGYSSSWDFALALTNLHDSRTIKASIPDRLFGYSFGPGFEAGSYKQSTRADYAELARAPAVVLERLIGLYLRSTHNEDFIQSMLEPPEVGR
jgi:hypothetical protein